MLKPFLTASVLLGLILVLSGTILLKDKPLGTWLDPLNGLYLNARNADQNPADVPIRGLKGKVEVYCNERNVPHIYAEHSMDAYKVFGYLVAKNRLFQLDFLPKVAQGRLAESLGADFVKQDKFLRSTGMVAGANTTLQYLKQHHPDVIEALAAYADGVNQYVKELSPQELPLEFRLLGTKPDTFSPMSTLLIMQYMNFDLSWRSDDVAFGDIQKRIGKAAFDSLYPRYYPNTIPIIPENKGFVTPETQKLVGMVNQSLSNALQSQEKEFKGTFAQGYEDGVGSNNWAVSGEKSVSGKPMLAGDPHLKVTLPSIWYEAHIVSPEFNVYGVSIPGTPLPLIGYNENLSWTFTNTDSDQIDHYLLKTDANKSRYFYNGQWKPFDIQFSKINVKGGESVADTLWSCALGKVQWLAGRAVAIRWTAHEPNRTVKAILGFVKAKNRLEFDEASRFFDAPMQNILYADKMGNIAIRSTGKMPIRKNGFGGGLSDGTTDEAQWTGFVPFEELPSSTNPEQGYLASANQQLASADYPYYQRITWEVPYRALRINQLLRGKAKHSLEDFRRYQSDVHSVAFDFISEHLKNPNLRQQLQPKSAKIAQKLLNWNGSMDIDQSAPFALELFLNNLSRLTWDEFASDTRKPSEFTLFNLQEENPQSRWFDVRKTATREDAVQLYDQALALTADSLKVLYGSDWEQKKWGDVHQIRFNHLLSTLKPLGRGGFPYSGFRATLSPAALHETVNSASWRMLVDFANGRVQGYGVYPGGQSGNPFSKFYDLHLNNFLYFKPYRLENSGTASTLSASEKQNKVIFSPQSS